MASSPVAAAALVLISVSVGYCAGALWTGSHSRLFETRGSSNLTSKSSRRNEEAEIAHGNSTDSPSIGDQSPLKVGILDDVKLVLVVRSDLGMSVGKIAAQCSHATLACYKTLSSSNPALLRQWERSGQTKIALRCNDEDELLLLQAQAHSLKLCARSIQDAGRTQVIAGSRTVLGIGPGARRRRDGLMIAFIATFRSK